MKNGLNKVLYDKRKRLGLNESKAAHLIHITPLELHLIERGYIPIRKGAQKKFIQTYELDENFFENDYRYPEEVFAGKKDSKFMDWFVHLFDRISFRLVSLVLTICFTGIAVAGACVNSSAVTRASTYFAKNITDTRAIVEEYGTKIITDIHDSAIIHILLDPYYSYDNQNIESKVMETSINFFSLESNIQYTFFKGKTTASYTVEEETKEYTIRFESRVYFNNTYRTKMRILETKTGIDEEICFINEDIQQDGTANIIQFKGYDEAGNKTDYNPESPLHNMYLSCFNNNIGQFRQDCVNLINYDPLLSGVAGGETFFDNLVDGVNSILTAKSGSGFMIIFGAAFAILFFACAFVYLFRNTKAVEKFESDIEEMSFEDSPEHEKKKKKKKFKKNWFVFPPLPETLIRVASIALLMAGSIGIYYIVESIKTLDLQLILKTNAYNTMINNFTIIGTLAIFFMKLDIYQNKKSVFLVNYALFFLGLGYYILLVFAQERLTIDDSWISSIGTWLLTYVPGNSIWGILAFNILIMFLFYEPKSYENNPKKMFTYRLMSLIPLSYLIASGILSIGKENLGWKIPFEAYSLFFSKSSTLVCFAVAFVFAVFFYKKLIYKHFKKDQADAYVKGNKYFYTKNLIAAIIVLIIGLTALFIHMSDKDNNFGKSFYILYSIPVILLYHPHLGKRVAWFDDTMTVLYGLSLCLGIVILAFQSISILFTL